MAYRTTTAGTRKPVELFSGGPTAQAGTAPPAPTVVPSPAPAPATPQPSKYVDFGGPAAWMNDDINKTISERVNSAPRGSAPFNTFNDIGKLLADTIGKITHTAGATAAQPPPVAQPQPPGTAENLFSQLLPQLTSQGATENLLNALNYMGFFTSPTATGTAFDQAQPFFGAPTQSQGIMDILTQSGILTDPTKTEQFRSSVMPGLEGMTGAGNEPTQFYQQHMANRPNVSGEPGLDQYYDTAVNRALEDMERVTAARGQYGGTAAQDMEGRRITELRAEQSNREADYNLRKLAEERAWEGLGGSLAGMSSESKRGWTGTLGNLAQASDATKLANLLGGGQIAGQADTAALSKVLGMIQGAQGADAALQNRLGLAADLAGGSDAAKMQRLLGSLGIALPIQGVETDRQRQPFEDLLPIIQGITGITQPAYGGMFTSDQEALESGAGLSGGASKENMTQGQLQGEAWGNVFGKLMELFTGPTGGGGFGGGGGVV